MWYLYSKEQDKNFYKSLEKIMKEIKTENDTEANLNEQEIKKEQEKEAEASYADYTFKEDELESKFEVENSESYSTGIHFTTSTGVKFMFEVLKDNAFSDQWHGYSYSGN